MEIFQVFGHTLGKVLSNMISENLTKIRNWTIEKEDRKKHRQFELQQETSNIIEFEYSI